MEGVTSPFPRLGLLFCEVRSELRPMGLMSAPSPKGCDGGPVLQLMYTNSTFRSPSNFQRCVCPSFVNIMEESFCNRLGHVTSQSDYVIVEMTVYALLPVTAMRRMPACYGKQVFLI